jgi:hypothetical protein
LRERGREKEREWGMEILREMRWEIWRLRLVGRRRVGEKVTCGPQNWWLVWGIIYRAQWARKTICGVESLVDEGCRNIRFRGWQ